VNCSVEEPAELAWDATYEKLSEIDWSFASALTRGETHGVHPYPAKFIPQIPRALIALLHPGDDSAVLDPFCGSGTTLVEAVLAGRPAIGVDLSPLACLISKVKVTPLRGDLVAAAAAVVKRAAAIVVDPPAIPAIDHWFKHDIQRSLAGLIRSIDSEDDVDMRDALRVAFSRIVVRVSNQESDTRYAAIEKTVLATDVAGLFLGSAAAISESLRRTWGTLFPSPPVKILHRDILTVQASDIPQKVSLVVTSPPYPNAYEYWLYHKYRMYWLGMDPIAVRTAEIGSRPHYFKRNPQTRHDFERQLSTVFLMLARVVIPDGHVCFQVGNSIIHGEHVDNTAIVRAAAHAAGFVEGVAMSRAIPIQRKTFNPRTSRILDERIVVFRKPR
jgi:DNA modification methylase